MFRLSIIHHKNTIWRNLDESIETWQKSWTKTNVIMLSKSPNTINQILKSPAIIKGISIHLEHCQIISKNISTVDLNSIYKYIIYLSLKRMKFCPFAWCSLELWLYLKCCVPFISYHIPVTTSKQIKKIGCIFFFIIKFSIFFYDSCWHFYEYFFLLSILQTRLKESTTQTLSTFLFQRRDLFFLLFCLYNIWIILHSAIIRNASYLSISTCKPCTKFQKEFLTIWELHFVLRTQFDMLFHWTEKSSLYSCKYKSQTRFVFNTPDFYHLKFFFFIIHCLFRLFQCKYEARSLES